LLKGDGRKSPGEPCHWFDRGGTKEKSEKGRRWVREPQEVSNAIPWKEVEGRGNSLSTVKKKKAALEQRS